MYNPKIHHRRSIRLKGFDYSVEGGYFITLNAHGQKHLFGEIVRGEMILSSIGQIAKDCWIDIPRHYPSTMLDCYIIMPNHIHGIIIISDFGQVQHVEPVQNISSPKNIDSLRKIESRGNVESRRNKYQHIIPNSISSMILQYKAAVTRNCRKNNFPDFRWHRNYYERVIRSEKDLNRIRNYIIFNVDKWDARERPKKLS